MAFTGRYNQYNGIVMKQKFKMPSTVQVRRMIHHVLHRASASHVYCVDKMIHKMCLQGIAFKMETTYCAQFKAYSSF